MRLSAICLAIWFWIGDVSGSWFDLYNHASATVLSPMFRWHGYGESSSSASCCDIWAARNSLVFRVKDICSSLVNLCLHILPFKGL